MKIHLKGGLGNQLFQFAYLHNYISLKTDCKLNFIPDSQARVDRPFELSSLIELCAHAEGPDLQDFERITPLSSFLQNKERFLAFFVRSLTSNHDGTELHERRAFQFSKPKRYQMDFDLPVNGYFQHWRYVEEAWSLIEPEIKVQLKFVKSRSAEITDVEFRTVIHIRGGDFHDESTTTGVLSSDYYIRALDLIHKRCGKIGFVLVLTDDVEFAEAIVNHLNITNYRILGPQECSAWEAILLMSEAKCLVTANSTLSWWGAFLAYKGGSICVTPDPWHRKVSGNSQIALGYPGFLSVDSGLSSDGIGETAKEEKI
jgi:hypothetical protein